MDRQKFLSNVSVRQEVIGTPGYLSHFLDHTSSQRLLMAGNNMSQVEVIEGSETARFQTGYETKYGKYEFNNSERSQDIQVVRVIPKFPATTAGGTVYQSPSFTVIYIGCDDNRLGYFNIDNYTKLHAGFGYQNKRLNRIPSAGDFIPKEMSFYTAPNHDDELYNMGLNANVSYIPMWDTTDDAFVVSRSLANKLTHTAINDVVVNIGESDIPLNLYGDDSIYQCFPNVGDVVREDGILFALRKKDENTFLTDLTAQELCTPRPLHDDIFVAPPGAEIVDIQVFINHRWFNKINDVAYTQLMEYQQLHYQYYTAVINTYNEYAKQGYKCSPSFSNFVTRCKGFNTTGRAMVLTDKKEPIEFMRLAITYKYQQKVSNGFKLTGTDGSFM